MAVAARVVDPDPGDGAPQRRRRLPAASRRTQLLQVALETFASTGLDATTMEDIASAAGVTKPLLYQHFKSKRALFLELLDEVVGRLIEALTAAAGAAPGPRQQVEAGFSAYFHFVVHNESAVRLLLDSTLPHDERLAQAMRRVDDTIAGAIGPLIDADIDAGHQRMLAAGVVGMAEGVTRDWLRAQNERTAERGSSPVPALTGEAGELATREAAARSSLLDEEAELLARRLAEFAWAGLRLVHRDD